VLASEIQLICVDLHEHRVLTTARTVAGLRSGRVSRPPPYAHLPIELEEHQQQDDSRDVTRTAPRLAVGHQNSVPRFD
jgi:hypothetical protein